MTLTFAEGVQPGNMAKLTYDNGGVDTPVQDLRYQNAADFTVMLENRTGQTPATRPGRPNNLQADPDDGLVTLTWEPPTNTGGTEALTYQWRRGSTGDWESTGTRTTKTVTGLDNGTTYTFYVQAVNSAGAGTAASVTGRPAGRPGPPRNVMVEPGNTQVRIRWSPPANNGGSPIRKYEWKQGSSGTWTSTGTTTNALATGLMNDTGYTFYVRAVNDSGEGPEVSIDATPSQTVFAPSAPTNLEAQPSNRRVVLTWDAPENNGGANISRYEWSEGNTDSWTSTGLTRRATISSLDNGTQYTFHVRAVNLVGEGPAESVSAIPATAPGAPRNLMADPDDRRVTLSWNEADDGGSDLLRYEWREGTSGDWTSAGLVRNVVVSDLQNGRRYTFYVRAVNPVDEGPAASESATPATEPGAPRNLMEQRGNEQVILSWVAPAETGGVTVTYEWRKGTDDWTSSGTSRRVTVRNLENGTLYTFEVRARNSSGPGPEVSVPATPATFPDAPENLRVEPGDGMVTLFWDPPDDDGGDDVIRYEWRRGTSGSFTPVALNTSVIAPNLTNNTTYTFQVRAVNDVRYGPHASITGKPVAAPEEPGPPRNLKAQPGDEQVTLTWDPPASNGGTTITDYQWSHDQVDWMSAGTDGTKTVTPLTNGTAYTFYVRARNSVGPGDPASVTATPVAPMAPGAPTNFRASPGDQRATLTWGPPTNDGGSPIAGFQWQQDDDGWNDVGATTRRVAVTGLKNDSTYTFYVRATNDAMLTGPQATASATPSEDDGGGGGGGGRSTVPGPPSNLSASPGDQQVGLSWDPPGSTGGSRIIRYEWRLGTSGGWSSVGTSTSLTATGLTNGTTYTFQVRAVNSRGPGPPATASATPRPPDVPTETKPGAPLGLTARAAGPDQINLSWAIPTSDGGSPITGYLIEVSEDRGNTWNALATTGATVTTFAHRGLDPQTTRHYQAYAINSVGTGPPSNIASATTEAAAPGAPTELMAQVVDSSRIDLSWKAPTDDGGSAITGYRIEFSLDGGGSWSVLEANTGSTETTYADEGLKPGTTRHYRVSAINSVGPGTPSNVATATTDAVLPGAPLTLNAAANGISQIDLSWSPPVFDGGAPLTGYQIEFSADSGSTWTVLRMNTGSTATTYAHEMLPPGATRHYRVAAANRVGLGPVSNVASATTGATTPGAPLELAAAADGTYQIDLSWSPPAFDGGSAVIGYRIDVSTSSGGGWLIQVANTGSTATEYGHENLDPATTRYYRVFAINAEGTGPPSNVAGATTDATVPDRPMNLGAMATSTTRIDLSWNPPTYDGGSPVTSYEIEASDDGQSGWAALATSIPASYADMVQPGTTRYYRVRAVNSVGASLPSDIASATTDDPKERANQINLDILPYAAAAMTASTVLAITDRVEGAATRDEQGPRTNLGGFSSLAGMVGTTLSGGGNHGGAPGQDGAGSPGAAAPGLGALAGFGGLNLRQSLGGSSFRMPLGTGDDDSQQEAGAAPRTMLWGTGDYRVLDGPVGTGETDWDGNIFSLHVGADTRVRPDLLTGVALSRSTSAFDFTSRTGRAPVTGDYEADITSVHPYAAWFSGERSLAVWTTAGYGGGEVSIEESTGEMRSGDTRFRSGALGGSATVLAAGSTSLRAKAELWMTSVDVEENRQMDALAVDVKRGRLAMEGNRAHHFDSGDELALSLEAGLRYDGGDGAEGGALELGGGVRYARPSLGLTAEGQGRIMATRQDGYREWGFSGRIQIDPQTLGEGLALRLVPSWGDASGGVQQLWNHGVTGTTGNGLIPGNRGGFLNAEVEYGLRSFAGTPYSGFFLAQGGTRTFNSGVRYQASEQASLYLEASRREGTAAPVSNALILRGHWRLR